MMKNSTGINIKLSYQEGIISVMFNLLLFVIKYYAGVMSLSVALIADAWHTLSDSLTSLVVILGTKLSAQKPDKKHPFGHGRWEQISALVIALLLVIVGIEFIKDAVVKFKGHETAVFGWVAYIVTIVSIVSKEGLARYAFHIARKTGNLAVKADGWHHRGDALSSLVVLAGLFLNQYFWWVDSVLGVLVSLMLFYAAYGIVCEAVNKILGEKPSEEVISGIENIVKTEMGDTSCPHHYHIHNYGDRKEFTFHIKVPGDETVREAHEQVTRIEKRIKEEMNMVATIHIEPLEM